MIYSTIVDIYGDLLYSNKATQTVNKVKKMDRYTEELIRLQG